MAQRKKGRPGSARPAVGTRIRTLAGGYGRRPQVEALEIRRLLSATPTLLKDLNLAPQVDLPTSPASLTAVGSTLFFTATDTTHGRELWKTDGTAAGTVFVKDIRPGLSAGSNPTALANVNGTLFFSAWDGNTGL